MVIGVINQLSYRLGGPNGLVVIWFLIWLVVDLPLWKIWKSVGMMKFPIYGKIKNVPNHQPDFIVDHIYIYISILTGGSSYLLLLVEWEPTVHKPVRNGHQFFQICCMRAKPMCPLLKQVIRPFSPYTALSLKFTWLVVYLPSWNIWVRQWEGWHPIYEMENNPNVWNHQPVTYFLDEIKNFSNNAHVHWCKHGFVWKYMKILWCVKQK